MGEKMQLELNNAKASIASANKAEQRMKEAEHKAKDALEQVEKLQLELNNAKASMAPAPAPAPAPVAAPAPGPTVRHKGWEYALADGGAPDGKFAFLEPRPLAIP